MSRLNMAAISRLTATCFYIGYLPVMPGTWSSAAALLFYYLAHGIPGANMTAAVVCFILGVWASGEVEKETGGKDPSIVVIDEFAGQLMTFALLPFSFVNACLGFVFFRFFDIIKTPLGRRLERLPAGWGIMLDDVFAALLANICLRIINVLLK